MFSYAIKKISKAMFPIFRIDQISANQSRWSVAGTGFFISSNGNFVTVNHLFKNSTPQTKYLFLGFLPDKISPRPLEIKELASDSKSDFFVGKIPIKTPNHVILLKAIPPVGRSVCIGGYPLAQIKGNNMGGIDVSGVRRYFQPSFLLDYCSIPTDGGSITHEGFLVRDFGLFGMSGGPVFDTNGDILGIQGSVTNPRESVSGSRKIIVENAVAIQSKFFLNFIKQRRIRIN